MGVMTINTATRTRLVGTKRPVRLGLSALLLVSSVRVKKLMMGSTSTKGRLILIAFPLSLRRRGINHDLL